MNTNALTSKLVNFKVCKSCGESTNGNVALVIRTTRKSARWFGKHC